MSISFDSLAEEDIPILNADLEKDVSTTPWLWMNKDIYYTCLKISMDGELVGFITYKFCDEEFFDSDSIFDKAVDLYKFYIIRDKRGGGVGKRAFKEVLKFFSPTGRMNIIIQVKLEGSKGFWNNILEDKTVYQDTYPYLTGWGVDIIAFRKSLSNK